MESEKKLLNIEVKKVACIGAGYVGGPTMAVFSKYCKDIKFIVYDISKERISRWNSDSLPIYEPGLEELVFESRGKNLFFTTDINEIVDCEVIFLAVNTPTKLTGEGAGKAANLKYIELCTRTIKEKVTCGTHIIVEKSTVPIRTAECIKSILNQEEEGVNVEFHVLSNPEFMAEGTAVRDLLNPHRVIIGGDRSDAIDVLSGLYERWIPKENIVKTNVWSSELSKLISNTFLAQRISSINAISALCEKSGADCSEVSKAVGRDQRIGRFFLQTSVGFGGSCFQKDILNLVYLCEQYGLKEVAQYFEGVITINEWQKKRFSHKVVESLFHTVTGKELAMFGFAFKKNTGDTRESASIYVARDLLNERARLRILDPKVEEKQIVDDINNIMSGRYHYDPMVVTVNEEKTKKLIDESVQVIRDPYECVKGAHAIMVLTEWDEFKEYDYEKIFKLMKKPAWIFDGRVILDREKLRKIGFNVFTIGKSD